MRPLVAAACALLCGGLAWRAEEAKKPPSGPVVSFTGVKGAPALGFQVVIDGKSPDAAWSVFLGELHDYFDRDGDGSLSRGEAARLFPLPLPGGKELTFSFDLLDADKNRKVSRAELEAYCRRGGSGPVVVVFEPVSGDDLRLGAAFEGRLVVGGKLTRKALRGAAEALRPDDLNEDEYLEAAELLDAAPAAPRPGPAGAALGKAAGTVLRLDVGAKSPGARLSGKDEKAYRIVPAGRGAHRLYGAGWLGVVRPGRTTTDVKSAGEFLLAQFTDAGGDARALTKAELEDDATLSGLLDLFDRADHNGDGLLGLAELKAYLQLVERAVAAQVWVTVRDRGRNPLPFLDADGDGRLSYAETLRATDLLARDATEAAGLPRQFEIAAGGPRVSSLGGVALPSPRAPRTEEAAPGGAGPAWFKAMDRNRDGVVSPREFVGPPEAFAKLDRDADGAITPEEAALADAARGR